MESGPGFFFWSLPATLLLWISLRFSLMLKILALPILTQVFSDSSVRIKSTFPGLRVVAEPVLRALIWSLSNDYSQGKKCPNDWTNVRWPSIPRLKRKIKSIQPAFVDIGEWVIARWKLGFSGDLVSISFSFDTWGNWNWLILNFHSYSWDHYLLSFHGNYLGVLYAPEMPVCTHALHHFCSFSFK